MPNFKPKAVTVNSLVLSQMYYYLRQAKVTNCQDRASVYYKNAATLITKCASYYKMMQPLLQNAQVITKSRNPYYKMRNLLQNAATLITKCASFNTKCYKTWTIPWIKDKFISKLHNSMSCITLFGWGARVAQW